MVIAVIDAHEELDVRTCDIPNNTFIQALMPKVKDGVERVMMEITGVFVGGVELGFCLILDWYWCFVM